MAKSSSYWDKRAIKRLNEAEKTSDVYIKRIKKIYDQAYKNIDKEIERVYKNYSKETGLDIQKLRELLTRSETKKTWEQMKRQGLDKYIKDNYKSRISRLEQIQAQIYAKAKQIYPKEELEQTMCYKGVINNSYYKAVYDTQMGTGYDFSFNKIDNRLTNALLNEKWSGGNYSGRIWGNTDILADSLSQVLGGALLSGQSIEKTTKQIKDRFNVSKYYAERLVRTETNHFNNEADAMAYEEMGIDKYVFVATLDSRTSKKCQNMDNKVFDYKDKEVGVNFPPLHPNCRSKTRGYLEEEMEKTLKRRAKNPITGQTEIIDNISYKDWLKQHNVVDTKNNMFRTSQNVIYNTKSLSKLNKGLVETNTKRLSELLNKYPKVGKFIKDNSLSFGGKTTDAIAVTSHSYDMKRLGIYLSNDYYNKYSTYQKTINKGLKTGHFMPCSDKSIDTYALNHEFGHLVENYLINEYNINNPIEFSLYKKNLLNATTDYEAKKILRDYENNICDKIAQDIYGIALKNNKDFKLNDNLSKYGRQSSKEFFAECFANMESGKLNDLGKAMKEYLKGVM